MKYVELVKAKVSQGVLDKFDCGHPDFNDFWLKKQQSVPIAVMVLHMF